VRRGSPVGRAQVNADSWCLLRHVCNASRFTICCSRLQNLLVLSSAAAFHVTEELEAAFLSF
jgi:hypothetical protein